MINEDILAALAPVVEVLQTLGVDYHIGGSVASSVYGIARSTIDADVVADLWLAHVQSLDQGYLRQWAARLAVLDLLERAWEDAGLAWT